MLDLARGRTLVYVQLLSTAIAGLREVLNQGRSRGRRNTVQRYHPASLGSARTH